ncbi:MAG: hypothetical protein ABI566_01675 [Pseudolysinimonas sp.]
MRTPTARTRRLATLIIGPTAILVAGLLVWNGSSAAFTATTRNSGNNWETGSVLLSDDDLGTASFSVTGIVPGQTGTKCLVVTSESTVPGEVRIYVDNVGAQGLENHITITLETGTGGSFADCTGFTPDAPALPAQPLATIGATIHDYATGGLPWVTTGTPGETKSYRAVWTFDVAGLTQAQIDALQGKSVSASVVWELQSTL